MKWVKIILSGLLFVVYCILVSNEIKKPAVETTFSGYVLEKHDLDKKKKGGDYDKVLYLVCKNQVEIETFEVSPTTYFKYKIGDKISFEVKNDAVVSVVMLTLFFALCIAMSFLFGFILEGLD